MAAIIFLTAFFASVIGTICGIGGGVLIKPVLDMLSVANVSTISFLSSCTVLSMSLYSVVRSLAGRESTIDLRRGTPLALGASAGGVIGVALFHYVRGLSANADRVGAVQAGCLALFTLAALIYTLLRGRIRTRQVSSLPLCLLIGAGLGVTASFLGIGGGPFNLVALYFFFSMETKTAAQNSLYIILFSQIANLTVTALTGQIPPLVPQHLALMVAGGILGGIAGRAVGRRISAAVVQSLFLGLMGVIILISCYNVVQFV